MTTYIDPLSSAHKENLAIIGIGKLGLSMALLFEAAGHKVTGIDILQDYVDALNEKRFYSDEPGITQALKKSLHFHASTQLKKVVMDKRIRILLIVLPTTSEEENSYSTHHINALLKEIQKYKQPFPKHLIIVSTTPPGYCQSIAKEMWQSNYHICYHPEFIAQGNILHDLKHPHFLLIGRDKDSPQTQKEEIRVDQTLLSICHSQSPIYHTPLLSAEIAKLAINCYLSMKISFANSIGDLATHTQQSPEEILAVIGADKRIGDKYLRYGYGYGGPCLPKDNQTLQQYAEKKNIPLILCAATANANKEHLNFQKNQLLQQYKNKKDIVFSHISYKKSSMIIEQSQALALAKLLAKEGKNVTIKERKRVIEQTKKQYGNLFTYQAATPPFHKEYSQSRPE